MADSAQGLLQQEKERRLVALGLFSPRKEELNPSRAPPDSTPYCLLPLALNDTPRKPQPPQRRLAPEAASMTAGHGSLHDTGYCGPENQAALSIRVSNQSLPLPQESSMTPVAEQASPGATLSTPMDSLMLST